MLRRVLVVVGFLTMLVGAFLDRRGLGTWTLERRLDTWTAGIVVIAAVAGLLALAPARRVRVAGTALGAPGLVGLVVIVVVSVDTGLPGPSLAVLAVGAAVLAVVGVAGGFVEGPPPRARGAAVVASAVGAALLVVGVCGVAVPLVVDAPVRAWSVVTTPSPPAAVPGRPTGVAWTWTALDGVRDVRAAGSGVVVADDSGVTALDGPTGGPLWGFHREGAALRAVQVTPDRRTVVLAHGSTGYGDDEAGLATVLDATTGSRLAGTPLPPAPCAGPTAVVAASVIAVCRGEAGASATVDGGPPILLARIDADGSALEALDSGVRIVPAPGAVVVAGTSRSAPVVQGLS